MDDMSDARPIGQYEQLDERETPFIEDVTAEVDRGYDGDVEGQLPELQEVDTDDESASSEREPLQRAHDETGLVHDFRKLLHDKVVKSDGERNRAQAKRNLRPSLKRSHSTMLSDSDENVIIEPTYSNTIAVKRPRRRLRGLLVGPPTPAQDSENAMDIDVDVLSSPRTEPQRKDALVETI